ncbi:HpcH/HpaI aldolase/citrate lyase family protein [Martelella soudanensis]|uniref:HpcH/HpaI aldolase/citrate lyase family protein n=1 Tax=unclassified Martelella TaxID=2629616 RepID=UPI0015DF97C0|nr:MULTISPECIES: CoA ester lyase [unclassified Martelella]
MSAATCIAPLFVPGDRPELFSKAAASGADLVILDLEDAVALARKNIARKAVSERLPGGFAVRVNAEATGLMLDDAKAVEKSGVLAVVLPKAEDAGQITLLRSLISRSIEVIALIETAKGLDNVKQVALKADRLAFGSIDYAADMGCDLHKDALLPARHAIVLASRLAGLPSPIDGVTADMRGGEGLRAEAAYSASLGFGGKLCIHPSQIELVKEGFFPTETEIAWAQKVAASGDGVVNIGGEMIDAPVRDRANRILRLAGIK